MFSAPYRKQQLTYLAIMAIVIIASSGNLVTLSARLECSDIARFGNLVTLSARLDCSDMVDSAIWLPSHKIARIECHNVASSGNVLRCSVMQYLSKCYACEISAINN